VQNDNPDDIVKFRNDLFDSTKKKQLVNLVPRLEKVEVSISIPKYLGVRLVTIYYYCNINDH